MLMKSKCVRSVKGMAKSKLFKKDVDKEIIGMRKKGMPIHKIAEVLNIGCGRVSKVSRDNGITRLPRKANDDFFSNQRQILLRTETELKENFENKKNWEELMGTKRYDDPMYPDKHGIRRGDYKGSR